jgi:sugar phosphate isomerase/epimerase
VRRTLYFPGGTIAVETWTATGTPGYSYAVWPEQLVRQVEEIAHPNVGICIDFGHVYLASHWYGFDYVEGIRTLAPHTIHFHVQDLTAIDATGDGSPTLGRGDLHLPPGWGDIPFDAVFSSIDFPRNPIFNVEIWGTRFLPYRDEVLAEIKRLAGLREQQGRN